MLSPRQDDLSRTLPIVPSVSVHQNVHIPLMNLAPTCHPVKQSPIIPFELHNSSFATESGIPKTLLERLTDFVLWIFVVGLANVVPFQNLYFLFVFEKTFF